MKVSAWLVAGVLTAVLGWGQAFGQGGAMEEKRTTVQDQQVVAVTIYNEDLALVKDQRRVQLDKGENHLTFREVSAQIRPETALLRSLSHPGALNLMEQNFDFDLLTPQKLLEKYVGRKVLLVKTHPQTGAESIEEAQVLAAGQGVVLKVGERIEAGVPGRLVYPDVPQNLRDRPTLVTTLTSTTAEPQQLELSYLTSGLSWKADYVAELAADEKTLDLSGWVTLNNRSGATYRNARLQLVAGDVNRVRPESPLRYGRVMEMAAQKAALEMAEESLFEYHLYTLGRATTLAENQIKQVALLSASGVETKKTLELRGQDYYYRAPYDDLGTKLKVGVYLQFENREKSGMGMPLPKGVVRVYKKDKAGNAQFVGEDSIDHSPKNETIRLKLGEAFDVTADKKQTDFKKISGWGAYNYQFESSFRIELKNAKPEAVSVKVIEPMPGDWEVLKESHPHTKETSGTALWQIDVPAEGKTVLEYRVRVRY